MRTTVRGLFSAAAFTAFALASTASATADKSTKPRIAVLEFTGIAGSGGEAKGKHGHKEEIEILSYSFGQSQADALTDGLMILRNTDDPQAGKVSKVDGFAIKQKAIEPGAEAELQPMGNTKWKNITLKRAVSESSAARANDRLRNAGPKDGWASAPRENGNVTLMLARPWAACTVGDRFNGAYLVVGTTHRYSLDGATVAACHGDTVTLNYAKAAVVSR